MIGERERETERDRERQRETDRQTETEAETEKDRAVCESRGGHNGLPVPNSPYGLCGGKTTLNLSD